MQSLANVDTLHRQADVVICPHKNKNSIMLHYILNYNTVDAAYKTHGCKIQSLVRLKIDWNGPDVYNTLKKNWL